MAEYSLPPSDEPFDFRHQAARYARRRPPYTDELFATIAAHAGPARGRTAVDLGSGTGGIATRLDEVGWRVCATDVSLPMLAEGKRGASSTLRFVRAAAESLPLRSATAALLTCGTAFHWFAAQSAVSEIERVLAPGGYAAVFWRHDTPDQLQLRLVGDLLRDTGAPIPADFAGWPAYFPDPFSGSSLVVEPPRRLTSEIHFMPSEFSGYIGTLEWARRFAGAAFDDVLERLHDDLERRFPDGFAHANEEHLFLAHKAA